jgi:hypothetical protein
MIGTHGPGPFAGGKNSIRPRPLKTVSCAPGRTSTSASLAKGVMRLALCVALIHSGRSFVLPEVAAKAG